MAYATRTDLTRLGIRAGALSGVSDSDQDAALEAASDLADSYMRSRYVLPLTGYGDDLKRAVCSVAAWDLLSTRGFAPQGSDEAIQIRQEQAIAWFKDVSAGRAAVSGGLTTPAPSRSARAASAAKVASSDKRGW